MKSELFFSIYKKNKEIDMIAAKNKTDALKKAKKKHGPTVTVKFDGWGMSMR